MVLPVRGCKTCRQRKVKCDTTRPICNRCVKVRRECVWDPNDHAGFHFKSENAFAGGKPRRLKNVQTTELSNSHAVEHSALNQMTVPLSEHAFLYWVQNYVFRPDDLPDIGHEYGTYVLFAWIRSRPGSSLHLALHALSHAIFGKARKLEQAANDAHELYAQSIVIMRQEMQKPASQDLDRLLITIMLMGLFENITFSRNQQNAQTMPIDETGSRFWKTICHHEGAIGLLKIRLQLDGKPSLPVDKVIRRQVIRSCVLRASAVPEFLHDGEKYGEEGPALTIDSMMVQVAALRAKTVRLLSNRPLEISFDERHSLEITFEAEELDARLASWETMLLEDWRFSRSVVDDQQLRYPSCTHTYTSHGHASVWNRYRALRLIVNSIRIRCLSNVLQHHSSTSAFAAQQEMCYTSTKTIADDLCASLRYFFNSPSDDKDRSGLGVMKIGKFIIKSELDILPKLAWLLAWPLAVALNVEGLDEPQRMYLTQQLRAVARSLGDAVLESVAERSEFRF